MNTARKLNRIKRAYGPNIPSFLGSPHEGEPEDAAEIALHELSHAQLLGIKLPQPPEEKSELYYRVEQRLDSLPRWLSDLNEIRAIAVELRTLHLLDLKFRTIRIRNSGHRNMLIHISIGKFNSLVNRAQRTKKCQTAASTLLALIQTS
jgi:hypothetical protein